MAILNAKVNSVHAAALILGAAGLLSRLLGIFRDRMLAARFGAGRELDIYYASFQIPDFLSILFLLGAGSAAILPIFQEYMAHDEEKAKKMIMDLATLFIIGSMVLSVVAFFLIPLILPFMVPGFGPDDIELAVTLSRIMLLSPLLLGLSSIFSSVVQSFERFSAYALSPIFYNIGIIFGIMVFLPIFGIKGLAFGVVLGAFLHFLIQFFEVWRLGFNTIPPGTMPKISEGVKRVASLSFPRVIAISISQFTLVILVALGSTLVEGSISVMQLAQNLYFLPIGIFGVSYAVAIFPRLSQYYIKRNAEEFFREVSDGIRMILFWIVPSAVLFIILRAHLVRVALGSGEFSWEDTRLTSALLAALCGAMFAGGLSAFLIKCFYALESTRLPLAINAVTSAFSVVLAYLFVKLFSSGSVFTEFFTSVFRISDLLHPEVLGLAFGYSIGLALNIILLYIALSALLKERFSRRPVFVFLPVFKILAASLIAGIVSYAVRASFSETLPLITFAMVLVQGVAAGIVGFAVYFLTLYFLGSEDIERLIITIRRRLFRMGILPQQWDGDFQRPDQNII